LALKPAILSLKELARLCLDYLARNPDQLVEFMVQSGLTPDSMRRLVGTEGFSHGLVDYVVANEPLLLAIAAESQLSPESITQTWARLHQHEA
jgi:hypothetical protein